MNKKQKKKFDDVFMIFEALVYIFISVLSGLGIFILNAMYNKDYGSVGKLILSFMGIAGINSYLMINYCNDYKEKLFKK